MEQERFMVIDNQKGVVIPLQADKSISIDRITDAKLGDAKDRELEEKVNKIQVLIKALVKQSIKDTIKEYNLQLTEELKEFEKDEMKRWDRLEEADLKRWKKLQEEDSKRWKQMEDHFKSLDKSIREKQEESKRKKHSIFN